MSKGDLNISNITSSSPEDNKKFKFAFYRMARSGGGLIYKSKLFLALFTALFQSLIGDDREKGEKEQEETKPKVRMTKPKGMKVTFQDMVKEYEEQQSQEDSKASEDLERNEGEIPDEEETCRESEDSSSESEGSESEDEKNIVLTPDMADLMLSYLDLMNLRMLQCECTTTHLLKRHIAGAQERLDEAKRLLDNVPTTMSHTERKVYMLEICQYVESIFSNLERLSVKVVKRGGENMCDIIDEFSENVEKIESTVVERPPEISKIEEERFSDDALWVMETGVMVSFVVLSIFVVFLLTREDIGAAFAGFLVRVWNNSRGDFKSGVVANETIPFES